MNGCGGEGSYIKPPYHIFFDTSCNKHDLYYDKGGDAFDRWIADIYLLKFMRQDCNKMIWYKRPYYYIRCRLYYVAIRLFGFRYFNYK